MPSDFQIFNNRAQWDFKNDEVSSALGYKYAVDPLMASGRFALQVLPEAAHLFDASDLEPLPQSVPPAPTFTAEQIVSQHFSAYQIAALQRLEMALLQAGKPLGPAMSAAKTWLESVMLGWAVDPTPKPQADFGALPNGVTFESASAEAVAALQS